MCGEMKQFQAQYRDEESFSSWLSSIQALIEEDNLEANALLFHIFSDSHVVDLIEPIIDQIKSRFQGALYAGCTGTGGVIDGRSAQEHVIVSASVFEHPDTKVEILQLPVSYEQQEESSRKLVEAIRARPWVKAIEMLTTAGNTDIPNLCKEISSIDEGIQLFGGGAAAADLHDGNSSKTYVVSPVAGPASNNAVFVLLGGEQLHVRTSFLTGWRNLGLPFEATDSHRNILKSLDHQPALDVYDHYVDIPHDEHFFDRSIVFPLCLDVDGIPLLRVATDFTEEGHLILGADIAQHSKANIAYGDPAEIMPRINNAVLDYQDFDADAILLYSCAGRQVYWGAEVDKETLPFQNLAPTFGFYTAGELYRNEKSILFHNLTIVLAAIREGEPTGENKKEIEMMSEGFSRQIMINRSLTTFINAATEQLVEANNKLQAMAITDGLTQLFTREETERRIRAEMHEYLSDVQTRTPFTLMMLDLDHFKEVNDTFGHQEGDAVLQAVADLFHDVLDERKLSEATVGRWGGEEFMFLLPGMATGESNDIAEEIRTRFESLHFPISGFHTLSAGITGSFESDTADSMISRVDKALYAAKNSGRNCSVILDAS